MQQVQEKSDSDDSFKEYRAFDAKERQRELAKQQSQNYRKVIDDFTKYIDLRIPMNQLIQAMNRFENKIEKVKKSNQYDIREINNKTNQIINIGKLQDYILQVKNNVCLAQKSVVSARQENQLGAIRQKLKIKPCNQRLDIIMTKIQTLIDKKVSEDANKKINQWVETNRKSQLEMGQQVLLNCEQMLNNNQSFGRVTLFNAEQRSSIVMFGGGRNSMLRSSMRQSVMQSSAQVRPSFFQQFNQNQQRQSVVDQSRQIIVEQQSQPSVWEFQIDFSLLKQPLLIYDTLMHRQEFFNQLRQSRIKFLHQLCVGDNSQFKDYLSGILGFILMDIEISKGFKDYEETKQIFLETYKQIEKQTKKTYETVSISELILVKKDLQLFSLSLAKLNLYSLSNQINKTINDQFISYCNRRIDHIRLQLQKVIADQTSKQLIIDTKEQYDQICKILVIQGQQNQRTHKYELNVSRFVNEILEQINNFIDGSIQYLSNLNDYFDDNVIFYMDVLLTQICEIFKSYAQSTDDFIMLTQTTLDFNHIECSIKHYRLQIEHLLQVTSTKDLQCINYFRNTRYAMEEAIQQSINKKLVLEPLDWAPLQPNKGPHDSFLLLIGQFAGCLGTIQVMVTSFFDSSVYLAFKQLNSIIWKQLLDCKTFNILGLVNIEIDLLEMLKICNTEEFPESIREVIQLLDLFLRDQVDSYLDQQKRTSKYNYLNPQKLVKLFPKYKKIVHPKYQEVRKRDLEAIVKRIQDNPQIY